MLDSKHSLLMAVSWVIAIFGWAIAAMCWSNVNMEIQAMERVMIADKASEVGIIFAAVAFILTAFGDRNRATPS